MGLCWMTIRRNGQTLTVKDSTEIRLQLSLHRSHKNSQSYQLCKSRHIQNFKQAWTLKTGFTFLLLFFDVANQIANCLITHAAVMEQHHHSFGILFEPTIWVYVLTLVACRSTVSRKSCRLSSSRASTSCWINERSGGKKLRLTSDTNPADN